MAEQNRRQESPRTSLSSFTVEFGDDGNRQQTINHLRLRVRGRFDVTNILKKGRPTKTAMVQMPVIPGIHMKIIPADMSVEVFDPLESDDKLREKIENVMSRAFIASGQKIGVAPRAKHKLNKDQFKSILIETLDKLETRSATVVSGTAPSKEDVDKFPGRELYDPWSTNARRPRYVDQVDEYLDRIERTSV